MTEQEQREIAHEACESRAQDLKVLLGLKEPEGAEEIELYNDGEGFYEYGLSFDYVAPGTFRDQEHGYFRYQFSWGGPSEEVRYYVGLDRKPYRTEFWYLDWFTGVKVHPNRNQERAFLEALSRFDDCGALDSEMEKAQ